MTVRSGIVRAKKMSTAVTQGIRVSARSAYLPERSSAATSQFAFVYTITIANESSATAQLLSRHWIITDGHGKVQEVRGAGVVGAQPVLGPGQTFEYTSWCMLETPFGSMRGSYQMTREDGTQFDAEIGAFTLVVPNALN